MILRCSSVLFIGVCCWLLRRVAFPHRYTHCKWMSKAHEDVAWLVVPTMRKWAGGLHHLEILKIRNLNLELIMHLTATLVLDDRVREQRSRVEKQLLIKESTAASFGLHSLLELHGKRMELTRHTLRSGSGGPIE